MYMHPLNITVVPSRVVLYDATVTKILRVLVTRVGTVSENIVINNREFLHNEYMQYFVRKNFEYRMPK